MTSTMTGDIRHHPAFASRHLRERDVWVYLPPGYDREPARRYPVLYLHDGNNVFDEAIAFQNHEWMADETLERLIRFGELPPVIAVAVSNTPDRLSEYAWRSGNYKGEAYEPLGQAYARLLVEELKPFVDATYRTIPGAAHTGVMGSSMGGLVSLYLARHYPHVFGLIGAMSPAVMWGERIVLEDLVGLSADLRLWVDMGGKEDDTFPDALGDVRALREVLRAHGYREGENLAYVEDPQGGHNEEAWAYRLPKVLKFLFGKNHPLSIR